MNKGTKEWKKRHEKLALLVDDTNAMSVGNFTDEGYYVPHNFYHWGINPVLDAERMKEKREKEAERKQFVEQRKKISREILSGVINYIESLGYLVVPDKEDLDEVCEVCVYAKDDTERLNELFYFELA